MPFSKKLSALTSRPYWYVYLIGIIILIATASLWWSFVYMSPKRVFWSMLDNSLATRGVTTTVSQGSGTEHVQQIVQFDLGVQRRARSATTLVQGGTEIKTEMLATPTADYSRYRLIRTNEKRSDGKPLDTSKVIDAWSKSDNTQQTATQSSGHQLFAQSVLGIGLPVGSVPVPVGAVSDRERAALIDEMRSGNLYDVSFKDVTKTRKGGRLLYTYKLKVQTIVYVHVMKEFAQALGLHELDQVDPNSYQSAQPLSVTITVDAVSRRLVSVDTGQGYAPTYQAYGAPITTPIPQHAISEGELKKRLSQL